MELILCALKCEANALFKHINNPDVKIECCGVGAKNLKIIKNLTAQDHITNIGVCAGNNIGEIYLCNKINATRPAYPDILFNTYIKQKEIKCLKNLADKKLVANNPDLLFDQESEIIWNESIKFLGPHQISYLKIVSDNGTDKDTPTKEYISKLIETKIDDIKNFIDTNLKLFTNIKTSTENKDLSKISNALKCSTYMENRLKQQLKYANIKKIKVNAFFNKLKNNKTIPVEHKKDGIKILNSLDNYIISENDKL